MGYKGYQGDKGLFKEILRKSTYTLTSWLSDKPVPGIWKLHKRSSIPSKTLPQTVHIHSFKLMQFNAVMPVGWHCWGWCFMLVPTHVLTTSILEHVHVVCGPEQANKLLHGGSLLGAQPQVSCWDGVRTCPGAHMHVVGLSGAHTRAICCGKPRDCGGNGLANMLWLWGDGGFARLGAGILSFRMCHGSRIGCNLVVW